MTSRKAESDGICETAGGTRTHTHTAEQHVAARSRDLQPQLLKVAKGGDFSSVASYKNGKILHKIKIACAFLIYI